jgi:hypothetical protein
LDNGAAEREWLFKSSRKTDLLLAVKLISDLIDRQMLHESPLLLRPGSKRSMMARAALKLTSPVEMGAFFL